MLIYSMGEILQLPHYLVSKGVLKCLAFALWYQLRRKVLVVSVYLMFALSSEVLELQSICGFYPPKILCFYRRIHFDMLNLKKINVKAHKDAPSLFTLPLMESFSALGLSLCFSSAFVIQMVAARSYRNYPA